MYSNNFAGLLHIILWLQGLACISHKLHKESDHTCLTSNSCKFYFITAITALGYKLEDHEYSAQWGL
jgi:hypothetical protein